MADFLPGDKVAEYGWSGRATIVTIGRLTATQVITTDGERFRRDTGHAVGDAHRKLVPLSDPRVISDRAQQLIVAVHRQIGDLLMRRYRSEAGSALAAAEQVLASARADLEAIERGEANDG